MRPNTLLLKKEKQNRSPEQRSGRIIAMEQVLTTPLERTARKIKKTVALNNVQGGYTSGTYLQPEILNEPQGIIKKFGSGGFFRFRCLLRPP